ncbi:MAG: hypothetical protein Q9221_003150 [Calogaya cf. arnoldii]
MLSSFSSAIATSSTPSPAAPLPNKTHASNLATFFCLSRPSPSHPALPPEIILQILAHPTRWLYSHSKLASPTHISNREAPIITFRPFTTQQIKTLQRIVFRFQSKDQGWSNFHEQHGSYNGSWTWFEAVVRTGDNDGPADRSPEDTVKKRLELQRNRHAGMRLENYDVVFEHEDPRMVELKSLLEAGDVLELRACARFPGWTNYVEQASVEMWCMDDLAGTVQ